MVGANDGNLEGPSEGILDGASVTNIVGEADGIELGIVEGD